MVYSAKDGGNLSVEQYERLKGELESGFTGAARAGRPLLLEGGLDWKSMSLTPKDMDFLEAKNGAAREIALAFGVPPMLLGIPGDNTYANFQEANRAFWRGTVLPLVGRIAGALGNWLTPAFARVGSDGGYRSAPPTLRLWFDTDQVDALSADREALWARIGAAEFLTVNEKRVAVGYGEIDGGEGMGPIVGKAGFDPNQPRVPAGSPDGGRWTDGGGGRPGRRSFEDQVAIRISPELERECLKQYERDTFHCTMVGSAACHGQAALRYSNCLVGRPIPPLNY